MEEEEAHTEEETEVTIIVDTQEEATIKDLVQEIDHFKLIDSVMKIKLLLKSEDCHTKSDMKKLQIFLRILNILTKVSFLELDKMEGKMDLAPFYLKPSKKHKMQQMK